MGEFDLSGVVDGRSNSSDAHSALENKGLLAPGSELLGHASESLGHKNGPKRDVWMTGFILTGFRT